MHSPTSRRSFLASSGKTLSAAWIALNGAAISSLAGCARDAARRGDPFTTLVPEEALAMQAFADRIVPEGGGLPGAEDAGAVYFVDRALGSFFADMLPPVRELLTRLEARARARDEGASGFAGLDPAAQDEVLRGEEQSNEFFVARLLVVAGVFADPSYGGNREGTGAKILGIEHQPIYSPPFGHYDAELVTLTGAIR